MVGVEFGRLETGELAYQIGGLTHALIEKDGELYDAAAVSSRALSKISRAEFYVSRADIVPDEAAFLVKAEALRLHMEQKLALGRKEEVSATVTPWGRAQHVELWDCGLKKYGTASHGGIKVPAALNRAIPDCLRNDKGWYEEDVEWAKVAFALPHLFTDRERAHAIESVKNWYPDAYEELTGVELKAGESQEKDRRTFDERHKNDWVVISASGEDDGVHCTASLGGARGTWQQEVATKKFLVPSSEYKMRSPFGFVIDPSRHEEMVDTPTMRM